MPAVYLGLGSNIEAPTHIRSAIRDLRASFEDAAFSPVYRSPAMGFKGDDFLNLVARIDTDMPPLELANWLHDMENRHGRDRSVPRWSSRTLDVDILLYGNLWLISPKLEIPRREILYAPHVLKPIADLAPGLVHPVERISMADLWSAFPSQNLELEAIKL
jgi:2-amino-4-hydroxy-6-hydroxymethyldihydropteridine diphosphokinase